MKPLSRLGISAEEKEMLATRLYPAANEIFLRQAAKRQKIDNDMLEELDYSNHPEWKMAKMLRDRESKAYYLKKSIEDGTRDISKFNVKYKTFEEAQEKDKYHNHVEMIGGQDIDEFNKEIDGAKKSYIGPDVAII